MSLSSRRARLLQACRERGSGLATRCLAGALLLAALRPAVSGAATPSVIPAVQVTALDGRSLTLPRDLPGRATVLILGFGRHSAEATTAWEKPVRGELARAPEIGFYDMAMLAEVPGFVRPLVVRRIRKVVPDALKPNFLTLTDHEAEWKQTAGFDPQQEDAAYVLLVDRNGRVLWATHEPFRPALFAQLTEAARSLAGVQH